MATAKQKKALEKGQAIMKKAIAWQKEGGFTTVTVKKYKRNTKDYLKRHAKLEELKKKEVPLSGTKQKKNKAKTKAK